MSRLAVIYTAGRPVPRVREGPGCDSSVVTPDAGAATGEPLFDHAARQVLEYLRDHVPLAFWSVTRVENGRQTYLAVEDAVYGLRPGGFHDWDASFCIHMAADEAPHVAPDAQRVPVYAAAGVNDLLHIGAYAGAVIRDTDGDVFGAICGLDPAVQGPELAQAEPLLLLLSRLLTLALGADRRQRSADQQVLQARLAADVDALTGVHSRAAWDRLLAAEAHAYEQLADPTAVVVVDVDLLKQTNDTLGHAAGDELLRLTARALTGAVRSGDPVARLGGDEFAVLLRQCTEPAAAQRAERIRASLAAAGVTASVGVAAAVPGGGPVAAQAAADRAMYEEKRVRRAERGAAAG